MPEPLPQLRAVLVERDGGVEAQLVELDIAVRATDEPGILRELQHALIVTYEISRDLGETPFVSVLTPPGLQWNGGHSKVGIIELPLAVAEALAAVLHIPKPFRQISVEKKAA